MNAGCLTHRGGQRDLKGTGWGWEVEERAQCKGRGKTDDVTKVTYTFFFLCPRQGSVLLLFFTMDISWAYIIKCLMNTSQLYKLEKKLNLAKTLGDGYSH